MPSPEKFKESLTEFKVPEDIIKEINEGFEKLNDKSAKPLRAEYFARALNIMEKRMQKERVKEIFVHNACCKSGARQRASKEFARINAQMPTEERLAKIGRAAYMNMGVPVSEEGGFTLNAVSYLLDGKYACGCRTFNRVKRSYPVSKSYCYCCAGHFKYHYEIMLGKRLKIAEIVSSPLDSDGKQPCVIRFVYE